MADKYEDDVSGVPVVLPVISGAIAWTPVITGCAVTINIAVYYRVGEFAEITLQITGTGGATGTVTLPMTIAAGVTIDTTKMGDRQSFGVGNLRPASGASYTLTPFYTGSSTIAFQIDGDGNNVSNVYPTAIAGFDVGDRLTASFRVPIAEWAGSANVAYGAGQVTKIKPGFQRSYDTLAYIKLTRGNGWGSTATAIRRFLNIITNTGVGLTYADSAANGASFTCTEDGLYSFTYSELFGSSNYFGLSLNSSQLTTDPDSITAANKIISSSTSAATTNNVLSVVLPLVVGDVVRPHTNTGLSESVAPIRVTFIAARLS